MYFCFGFGFCVCSQWHSGRCHISLSLCYQFKFKMVLFDIMHLLLTAQCLQSKLITMFPKSRPKTVISKINPVSFRPFPVNAFFCFIWLIWMRIVANRSLLQRQIRFEFYFRLFSSKPSTVLVFDLFFLDKPNPHNESIVLSISLYSFFILQIFGLMHFGMTNAHTILEYIFIER